MKIAVIGTRGGGPAGDGIDKALAEICPRLIRRGHAIDLFSERNGRAIAPVHGTRVVTVPGLPVWLGSSSHALPAAMAVAFGDYDIVNFVAADALGLYTLAAKMGRHRTVVSVHGLERPAGWGLPPPFAPEAVAARFADVITVVSKRLERFFRDAYGRETIHIPNGISPTAAPDTAPLGALGLVPAEFLLIADRLTPASGVHHALAALSGIAEGWSVVVAGLGAGDETYALHLRQMAAGRDILFLDRVTPPLLDALLRHSYLYVLPSTADDAPPTLLQAMAHGTAVVASDQPEHLDVVGADGFTFTGGDAADLRRVLRWLLDDADVVARMRRRAAAAAVNRYSWDRIAEAYEQVYASIT